MARIAILVENMFEDPEYVEDGNLITSRQPSDTPTFVKASLAKRG